MGNLYRVAGILFILSGFFLACSDTVSFSPFGAEVAEEFRNTTEKNLERISQFDTVNRPFKVALISDSHYHFKDLEDAIRDINRRNEFSFIIVTGDISENGLLKEFEIFHHIMNHSTIPYLTVIGNHDHLANGSKVYRQMFGPLNYTFAFHNVKFIAWDNTFWESEKQPDFVWLNEALTMDNTIDAGNTYHHVIPVSHIPPNDGQFAKDYSKYHNMLKAHDIKLSVHGHKHEFSIEDLDDELRFMTVGSPKKRNYAALSITPTEITISKIEY